MPHWSEGVLPVLDFETTGVDPKTARMVEAALLFVYPDGRVAPESYQAIVDPGVAIPEEAARLHGIYTERARAEGVPPQEALRELGIRLGALARVDVPLLIYNAKYDWPLLLAESRRHGVYVPAELPLFDPYLVDRYLDRYRPGGRRLEQVAEFYRVNLDEAHSAVADAVATAGIARALCRRYPQLKEMSVRELHAQQAVWFEEWKADFNAFLARKGNPNRVTGTWPDGGAEGAA